MNIKPRAKRPHGPETMKLQLIAMIDVVLFILLYFVMSSTMAADASQITATTGAEGRGGRAADLSPQVLFVERGAGGATRFRLGDRQFADRAVLIEVMKGLPKQAGIMVKAAGDISIEGVAAGLQVAKDAGFVKVSYVPAK